MLKKLLLMMSIGLFVISCSLVNHENMNTAEVIKNAQVDPVSDKISENNAEYNIETASVFTDISQGLNEARRAVNQLVATTKNSRSTGQTEYGNIALHKPVFAKSYTSEEFLPENIVDGETTLWETFEAPPQWIYIDLGEVMTIDGIKIDWVFGLFAVKYDIAIAGEDKVWTIVYSTEEGNGGGNAEHIEEFYGTAQCRYVALRLRQPILSFKFGIVEVELLKKLTNATGYLLNEVRTQLQKPTGPIYQEDLAAIKSISHTNAVPFNTFDLTGLNECINLEALILKNFEINALHELQNINTLTYLDLEESSFNIADIQSVPALKHLNISGCSIQDLSPIGILASESNLTYLNIENNNLKLECEPTHPGLIANRNVVCDIIEKNVCDIQYKTGNSVDPNFHDFAFFRDVNLADTIRGMIEATVGPIEHITPEYLPGGANEVHIAELDLMEVKDISRIGMYKDSVDYMYLDRCQITDYQAIRALTKLRILTVSKCGVTDVTDFGYLTNLASLSIRKNENKCNNFRPLLNLVNLSTLILEDFGAIKQEDVSAIGSKSPTDVSISTRLINLRLLHIMGSASTFDHIDNFWKLKSLENLFIIDNLALYNIDGLRHGATVTDKLRFLTLKNTSVSDLSPLIHATTNDNQGLIWLDISSCDDLIDTPEKQVKLFQDLKGLKVIQNLYIDSNYKKLTTLQGLEALSTLRTVSLRNHYVNDITPLLSLWLNHTTLQSVDLYNCPKTQQNINAVNIMRSGGVDVVF